MTQRDSKTIYADPTLALTDYLDDLLHTATERQADPAPDVAPSPPDPDPEPDPEPDQRAALREARRERLRQFAESERRRRLAESGASESEPAVAPLTRSEPPAVVSEPVVSTPVESASEPQPATDRGPEDWTDRPDWAADPFECLIFRVAGLQLAVPLVLLGAVHRMDSELRKPPGRPDWFMGLLPSGGMNLRVADTAEWVMSGRVPKGARDGYQFVIRLDDSEWGLACDEVAQSFRLDPDDVKWRSGRSRRPWLAGTVVRHMCALLDVRTMARLLAQAERDHRLEIG
ncbi:purine-binding chemotaxis protein CheW [Tamilnaduibacter salinus]|uniref:Purine-binding chemotaxis protein CheW n=1 Tax=Tamilnaduibacter salinus TaxID=1484056 RepID=A0A2U1D1U3_9GAMM|nr:chemotaxis protein CheW [Tamilnaduibacter salinus]PVY79278.1 purine-binding chemotaxis protein CheW [Tamilnaduibacter salinus]